jgi:zinc protease
MIAGSEKGLSPVRRVLDNGVVLLAKHAPGTPAVTLHATVHAGAVFDDPVGSGLAHFVARTIDRGTSRRSSEDIAEALDSRGVSLSTSVNRHLMSLVCTCLAEDLDAILEVLADVLINASFPETEVDARRAEIVTLIRQDEDNPASVATQEFMADLYGASHPYGCRVRGSVGSVESIGGDSLRRFHAARFGPASLVLALVGTVETERVLAAAAGAFESWNASPLPAPPVPTPTVRSTRHVRVAPMMDKAQADIVYGFVAIRRSDPSYHAYSLMNNILGQYSLGGRLGDSIRERQGMAYYVFSSLDANVLPGPLTVRCGVSATNVERAVSSIDEELSRFAADGPTEKEVAESKRYLVGSIPRMLETNGAIASFLQTVEFFGLGLDYDLRLPALLDAVSRDEVQSAARETLAPDRATIVVAGPYEGSLR